MMARDLARPEILALRPYVSAEQVAATIRLNANEAPDPPGVSGDGRGLNRYPEIHPETLRRRLAQLYSVGERNLLPTRGSSEAIDTLIRIFCRPGADNIVTTPPTFSMYRVYADIQGAAVIEVPLAAGRNFAFDGAAVLNACTPDTKLIFVCTPNNPTGSQVAKNDILALAKARSGRSLIVVDEAYVEFSERGSMAASLADHDNLVVLRTLSKAYGMAGARCGAVVAGRSVIELMTRILPPYAFSSPTTDCVIGRLTEDGLESARVRIARVVEERERLRARLSDLRCVRYVWPSASNFLLVQFDDVEAVRNRLIAARILIREFGDDRQLADCARITVGSDAENNQLLSALEERQEAGRCP